MARRKLLYILCLLAFLEVSCRIFWACLDQTWGLVVPQQIGRFDPDLGWSLKPGARGSSKATGARVDYAINSRGTRGPEFTPEKAPGVLRVLVLGDSHTFGFGIPEPETYANLLAGYFKDVEVINLAVSGFGVDQMLLRLRRDGFPLNPDIVVCYVPHYADFRHIQDSMWGMGKPRMRLTDGALTLENCPVANNSPLLLAAMTADSFLSEWCRTYEILRNTVYWLSIPRAKPGEGALPDPGLWKETVDLGNAIVSAMRRECRERGTEFVLATMVGELSVEAYLQGMDVLYWGMALQNDALILAHDHFRHPGQAANGIMAWELAKYFKQKWLVEKDRWVMPLEQ